jgi:SAM-dependent methyltransferase
MKNKIVTDKDHLPLIQKKKQYIEVPLPMECGILRRLWQGLVGILLLPFYVITAWILGAPGVALHFKCAFLALRLFLFGRISLRTCYSIMCSPMDSTRYFEFCEVLNGLAHVPFNRYLDVSSPGLVPLLLLMRNKAAAADMINPDGRDLQDTERLAEAMGLTGRCKFTKSTIETVEFAPGTFDLITCISVLEHIPSDREAVDMMWSLLRPGGRLVLTLPCMAQPLEQYISCNEYGVLSPESDGYTFWQRYYDEERLREIIFKIAGPPVRKAVYGECSYGLFYRNASSKRLLGRLYPIWRESYMMATEYRYFKTIDELPGEGVIMLEFVKP